MGLDPQGVSTFFELEMFAGSQGLVGCISFLDSALPRSVDHHLTGAWKTSRYPRALPL